jgi:transketolase
MGLQDVANEIRKDIIRMTYAAGAQGAHIGGSLSMCEIMAVLYHDVMKIDRDSLLAPDRDRLILSKGHGAIALYAALKSIGVLTEDELMTYKQDGSVITAHPTFLPEKGMEFASGSLGQGLSLGVGAALGLMRKGNPAKIYVIVGDGECDEGAIWEAAASASHYGLDRIVCIVDKNKLQYDGDTETVMNMESISSKFRAFGWDAADVNGHDCDAISQMLHHAHDRPFALVCSTVKGKGVSFIENEYKWHNASLTEAQYRQAMEEQEM